MRASMQPTFEYQLDPQDVVAWVSDDWLAFARENGAEQLNKESVVGKSLWFFIPDEPTRSFYRGIFGTVRATDQCVVVPFRCDSPTLRRFMRLEVRHHIGCGIDLKSILERVEPCERRVLLDDDAPQSGGFITMCSCCKNVLIEPRGWLPLDEADRQPSVCRAGKRPLIRYVVCDACKAQSARQRIPAIDAKLSAPGRTFDAESDLQRLGLAKERAALAQLVDQSEKKSPLVK